VAAPTGRYAARMPYGLVVPDVRDSDGSRRLSQAATKLDHPVASHKFQVGQTVTHQACAQSQRTRRRLRYNQNRGEFEYRIKSVNELHERVARESALTKA
jgi:hypothetical protein